MAIIDTIKIPLKCRCNGLYVRWASGGWHYAELPYAAATMRTRGSRFTKVLETDKTVGTELARKSDERAYINMLLTTVTELFDGERWVRSVIPGGEIVLHKGDGSGFVFDVTMTIKDTL